MIVCVYPPVACRAGQACVEGACGESPLTFKITPEKPTWRWNQASGTFGGGGEGFTASLTNVSSQPVVVSATEDENIEVGIAAKLDPLKSTPQHPIWISLEKKALDTFPQFLNPLPRDTTIRTLRPGETATFPVNKMATVIPVDPPFHYEVVEALGAGPGHYAVQFVYRYRGTNKEVYRGAVWSNEASFDAQ